ncbi:MAG: ABC transporter permease subunit [Candidatus Hadarchaeales archaeon]
MRLDGNRPFSILTLASLLALFLFFSAVLLSVLFYASPRELLSSLLSEEVQFSIRLSLATATVATVACMFLAVPAAYALSRFNFRGKGAIDLLLYLPIGLPPVALGAALLIFFGTPVGKVFSSKFVFEVPGIVLAQFAVISALATKILKATFDGIDEEYEAVARTLGCTRFQAFRRVTLHLARGGLLTTIAISWVRAVGEFGATVMLAGATRMKTETLPIAIYLSLQAADVVKMSVLIIVLALVSLAALFLIQRFGKGWPII